MYKDTLNYLLKQKKEVSEETKLKMKKAALKRAKLKRKEIAKSLNG